MTGVDAQPVFPHLRYGDAVHTELLAAGLAPDMLEAGLRTEDPGRRELFLTLPWLTGHAVLDGPVRLALTWSHLTGWAARVDDDVILLDVEEFAAPELLVDAARHFAKHGIDGARWVVPVQARWEHWRVLDQALNRAADRGVIAC